jgi:undecaprenyl-diphosphatase
MRTTSTILSLFQTGDLKVMLRVNRWHAPRGVRVYAVASTRGGDHWLWELVGAMVAVFGGRDRLPALSSAVLATASGILLFRWLKKRIGRARPCAIEPHCWHDALPPDQFSFPSGHTITAFAVATPIAHFYPEFTLALWFCACSVAVSRVVLGMHFVSDVLAGAVLGTALAQGAIAATGLIAGL